MSKVKQQSSLHKDYVSCYLREQIIRLSGVLKHLEDSKDYDNLLIIESLKNTENCLCNIRRFLQN